MEKKWEVKIDENGNEIAEEVEKEVGITDSEITKTDWEVKIDAEKKALILEEREERRSNLLLKKEIENQERVLIEAIVTDIELYKYSLAEAINTFPEYKLLIENLYEQRTNTKGTR